MRTILSLLPGLCTVFVFCCQLQATPPNFVVIFCDDLGYGDLACFGHPTIETPNLDRMAAQGQKWTNFYVGASVCTPSRAALLTGRLPIRTGMMSAKRRVLFPNSKGGIPATEWTIAELLKTKGYATAAIGKWHLGHLPPYLPTRNGFDSYWGIPYSNDMDAIKGFPNYRQAAHKDPHYSPPIKQYQVPILQNEQVVEKPAHQHTLTQRYTDKAIEFIRQHHKERFFVYLAHNLPHIPLFVGEKYAGASRRGIYGDVIQEIDAGVGAILKTLKDLNVAENTLVVFTSDNGPWLPFRTHGGSAGLLREGKGSTFEGGMREPTIFWWPGKVAPKIERELGATMDLLPTFCALAGVPLPQDRIYDGYDLSPLLLGQTTNTSQDQSGTRTDPSLNAPIGDLVTGYEHSPRKTIYYWRSERLYAIRVGPWKAHFITEGCYGIGPKRQVHDTPVLYNLDQDPSEKYDVASLHPKVVQQLQKLAETHIQSVKPVENQLNR